LNTEEKNIQLKVKPSATRILAIDFGMARLGIAISDESKILAMPLMTFPAEKKSEHTVAKLAEMLAKHQKENRYSISLIVIGLPLLMSGKIGFLADEVKHFAQLLEAATSYPTLLWDERLTSVQADRALREGQLTRKKRSKAVDTVAATLILQSYLDQYTRTASE
jgi:putative Holliday junction resolvase